MLKQWIVALRRDKFKPSKYSRLCSEHFKKEDFLFNFGRKTLKQGIVPTIFNFPEHLQKKIPKERSKRLKREETSTFQDKEISIFLSGPEDKNLSDTMPTSSMTSSTEQMKNISSSVEEVPQYAPGKPIRRKRSQLVYMGDASTDDLQNPKKFKLLWSIAQKQVLRHRKRIVYLETKLKRLKKKVKSLSDLLEHLKNEKRISFESHNLIQDCIPTSQKQLLLRQLKISSQRKFPPELRTFALTLHFYSNNAYNYVRRTFGNCLPHPNTIRKWYSSVDGSPGFTKESFRAIKIKSTELKKQGKDLVCSLMMDEMAIRKHLDWNGKRNIGYVNFGCTLDSDTLPLAKDVAAFLVVGVNCNWKIPVAYFLISSLTAEQRADLVKQCLIMLHDVDVKVISLTFDGAASNISMCRFLGADLRLSSLKTFFLHPSSKEEVFIILDACHMFKLIRNALGEWEIFYDKDDNQIKWQFFKDLVALQDKEGLHLGNKLTTRHIHYNGEKMKVKLAVQTFSSSVASALEYCDIDLNLKNFKNSEATRQFCKMFNDLFDILNTRNCLSKNPFRKSLSGHNINFIKCFFKNARDFILNLKGPDREKLVEGRRKTGFLGFLINMSSVEGIIEKYIIEKKYLSYLLTYKLSQDHLEMFFCAIRSKGGFNNNPTASQFESAYKRLLIHTEIKTSDSANCLAQDTTSILHVSSSTLKESATEEEGSLDNLVNEQNIADDEFCFSGINSQYKIDVIEYISGYVVRKLKKILNCETCSRELEELKSEVSCSSFLERKNKGGLMKPSRSVSKICRIAEQVFRQHTNFNGNVVLRLISSAKTYLNFDNLFPSLSQHVLDQDPINNHLLQLVNLVLQVYFKIRLHHQNKTLNEVKSRIRHKYSKLILFKNQ